MADALTTRWELNRAVGSRVRRAAARRRDRRGVFRRGRSSVWLFSSVVGISTTTAAGNRPHRFQQRGSAKGRGGEQAPAGASFSLPGMTAGNPARAKEAANGA